MGRVTRGSKGDKGREVVKGLEVEEALKRGDLVFRKKFKKNSNF